MGQSLQHNLIDPLLLRYRPLSCDFRYRSILQLSILSLCLQVSSTPCISTSLKYAHLPRLNWRGVFHAPIFNGFLNVHLELKYSKPFLRGDPIGELFRPFEINVSHVLYNYLGDIIRKVVFHYFPTR